MAAILKFYIWFQFWPFHFIGTWFCIRLPNFVQIGWSWLIYDVISILQDGGHSDGNPLPVWPRLTCKYVESYRHTKFWPDISIHGQYITTSSFWKQMVASLKIYFRFDFDLFAVIGVWIYISASSKSHHPRVAELWRNSDFQDGGRQPCWIWLRVMVAIHKI